MNVPAVEAMDAYADALGYAARFVDEYPEYAAFLVGAAMHTERPTSSAS